MDSLPPELLITIGSHLSLNDWATFTRTNKLINAQSMVWNILLVPENPHLNIGIYNLADPNMWITLLRDKFNWKDELFILPLYLSQPKLLYSVYRTLIPSPHSSVIENWDNLTIKKYAGFPEIIEQIFELNLYHKNQSLDEVQTNFISLLHKIDTRLGIILTQKVVNLLNYISKTKKIPYERIFTWEMVTVNERLNKVISEILFDIIRLNYVPIVKTFIENLHHPLPQRWGLTSMLNVALGHGLLFTDKARKEIFEYLLQGKYLSPDIDTLYYILINDNFPEYVDKIIHNFADQDIWQVISRFIESPEGEFFTNWNEEEHVCNLRLNNLEKLFSRINLLTLNSDNKVWNVLRHLLMEVSPLTQILLNNTQCQFIINHRPNEELLGIMKLMEDKRDSFGEDHEYRRKYINLYHQIRHSLHQNIIKAGC